ncbi:MAG: hypothetical protein CVV41_01170 [Candidatus Riflebacteria bacterium HGW-Riflebacteria-1]|jgi:hypothetical protein|nr:MAG: hypothetical protein CVV41_01170 [Candidatus Riflebacteria bacterium HGW-Riflebacteria-1]
MLNNPGLRKILIKVVMASFVLTLLIAAPYIARRLPKADSEKKSGSKVIRYGTKGFSWNTGQNDTESATGESSAKQLKPSFGNLPNELFPGNRPFSLDFHKLPLDFMIPQQPEITRTAVTKIRQLQAAEFAAVEAQQAMAKNYDKPQSVIGGKGE